LLDKIEVGSERPELPGHAASQIVAMATLCAAQIVSTGRPRRLTPL
jgi:hypothetical protein